LPIGYKKEEFKIKRSYYELPKSLSN